MVATHRRSVMTRGQGDAHDVTDVVSHIVADSHIASGTATVFIVGSTAAVTTIEFEPGAIADLNRLFEQIAPRDADYPIISAGAMTTDRATCAQRCSVRR